MDIIRQLFEAETADLAHELLCPFESRVIGPELTSLLIQVVKREHPLTAEFEATHRERYETDNPDGFGGIEKAVTLASFDEDARIAAVRTLAKNANQQTVFEFLFKVAQGHYNFSLRNMTYESVKALAKVIRTHGETLLERYRTPIMGCECSAAGSILLAGFGNGYMVLQAEIANTIRFALDPSIRDGELKYSQHQECMTRNQIAEILYAIFLHPELKEKTPKSDRDMFLGLFKQYLLDEYLFIFEDYGSINHAGISIAMHWSSEARVVNAAANYLERWGGTAFQDEQTCCILHFLSQPKAVVTQKLRSAIDVLERKPLPNDSSTRGAIRRYIKSWRYAKRIGT